MAREYNRKIVLEDGTEYYGFGFGYRCEKVCEIVFNTSMVGYQEIISDPTNTYQMIVMTYPLIGNYGITDEDFETKIPTLGGLVVREYNKFPSNFRYTKTLSEILEENRIPAISGVDTRKLARSIKENGSGKVFITSVDTPTAKALEILKNTEIPRDAVSIASCKKKWYSRTTNHKYNVIAVDCGIRHNLIRSLNNLGCNVTVVPYNTKAEDIIALNPNGILLSNGPGNPLDVKPVLELVHQLKGKYPICAVGLGHQIVALSYGAKVNKLKYGHRGANHPVKNLLTNKINVTHQNHGFVVDLDSLKNTDLEVTHINLFDNTVEGVRNIKDRIYTLQYNPEIISSRNGKSYLFDAFLNAMKEEN